MLQIQCYIENVIQYNCKSPKLSAQNKLLLFFFCNGKVVTERQYSLSIFLDLKGKSMTRDLALETIDKYFFSGGFETDLAGRVAYKTESNLPNSAQALEDYLDKDIIPYLSAMYFNCKKYPNTSVDAGPFLVAHRNEAEDLPTVLTYGHGDVIAGYDDQWDNKISPWEITKIEDRWYGRGTADNKGQHTINLAALKAVLETRGKLGFNVIVLIEMGEERGSPGLHDFCETNKDLLKADVFIASDGPRIHPDKPTIFMGSRGTLNFTLKLNSHSGGHHSGNWGGLLTNPGVVMANAIASIVDKNGKIMIEGWRNNTIKESVRKAISKLTISQDDTTPVVNPNWGEPDLTPAERVFGSNTFEVRAFETGNPSSPANAIPPSAVAFGHLRYVVGTEIKTLIPLLRSHLDQKGFRDIEIIVERDIMNATRLDPDHPWAAWVINSLTKSTGEEITVIPNLGGALPNDVFADILRLPTIWVPHSYTGCSQHAPNEHILEKKQQLARYD